MGREAACKVTYKGKRYAAKVHLDSVALTLTGALRLSIPLKDVASALVRGSQLQVNWGTDTISLDLGKEAAAFAKRILNPPTLLDKLGVKAGQAISVFDLPDEAFLTQLLTRTPTVSSGTLTPNLDMVICKVDTHAEFVRLAELKKHLKPNGAIWVVWKKGQSHLKESDVRDAAKQHGLVDVKVASFSPTLSALKLVIPRHDRPV